MCGNVKSQREHSELKIFLKLECDTKRGMEIIQYFQRPKTSAIYLRIASRRRYMEKGGIILFPGVQVFIRVWRFGAHQKWNYFITEILIFRTLSFWWQLFCLCLM